MVEYAYLTSSLSGMDHPGANCRQYCGSNPSHPPITSYTHCDGSPLKLSDSEVGSTKNYTADQNQYYCSNGPVSLKILFTLSESVQLSHTRLHYYNGPQDNPMSGYRKVLPATIYTLVNDEYEVWEPYYPRLHISGPEGTADGNTMGTEISQFQLHEEEEQEKWY